VKEFLMPYEELLFLAGARELNEIDKSNVKKVKDDQKDVLIEALLNKLRSDSGNDVTFIVGKEKKRIGANKYILSAASTHFEGMFCRGFSEAEKNEIEINDIQPDAFQVLIQWLYGQSFEDAINSVLRNEEAFTTEQECYETYYLNFLVHLLTVTDIYNIEQLKNIIENAIISSCINIHNVCEILEWSKNCEASQLSNYCINFIRSNKEIIVEQRLEYCAITTNEKEIIEESEMIDLMLFDEGQ
ncbi:5494_t:CDS:2, partial [Funneliformis caledonium]